MISKNPHVSNLMKIHPVGAELFHEDRWMADMTKLTVPFCNFVNVPEN